MKNCEGKCPKCGKKQEQTIEECSDIYFTKNGLEVEMECEKCGSMYSEIYEIKYIGSE